MHSLACSSDHAPSPRVLSRLQAASVEQMTTLTQAQLELQKAQETSPSQALVAEELRKRLEVLEAERYQLAASLSERQQEILSVSSFISSILSKKGFCWKSFSKNF